MDKDLLIHIIEGIKSDVSRIESKTDKVVEKVDQLLEFKWRIVGGSVVLLIVANVLMQIFSSLLK